MTSRRFQIVLVLVAAAALLFALDVAWAEEKKEEGKKVTIDQVPGAVKATILKEAGSNQIKEIEEEVEDGKTCYEAEWVADGKKVEIKVAADGKLLDKKAKEEGKDEEKEEEGKKVTIDQVPAAVKATILKEAGDNKIKEIEEETKDGKTIYEASWVADGKEVEIKVAADGKLLDKKVKEEGKDEEKEDKDDDKD